VPKSWNGYDILIRELRQETSLGAWALGNCIGPVIGGLVAQHTTWRCVFYIMFPFCVFGLISVPYLLTLKPKSATVAEKLARVDWFGGFLFMSSATAFLIAISWGGTEFAWNSVQTIVPLVLGLAGLGGTFVWEHGFAKEPFLKKNLFWCLSPICTYFCGAVQGLLVNTLPSSSRDQPNAKPRSRYTASSTIFRSSSKPSKVSPQPRPALPFFPSW
jgi:MFS family permease